MNPNDQYKQLVYKKGGRLLDFEEFQLLEVEEQRNKNWTIEEVYCYIYGWCAYYDAPWDAGAYCDVTHPKYRGRDWWEQWKHDHWVGEENMKERALADPYVRSYLIKFGILPKC